MDRVSSIEFAEYLALQRVDPIGELRMDMRIAKAFCRLAAVTAGGSHSMRDFMIDMERILDGPGDGPEQSVEEMRAEVARFMA